MKKKLTVVSAVLLAALLAVLSSFSVVFAADLGDGYTDDPKECTFEFKGGTAGDQFNVWRIVDISVNATTHAIEYSWNADFAAYFTDADLNGVKAYPTVADFMADYPSSGADTSGNYASLNAFMARFPAYINEQVAARKAAGNPLEPLGGVCTLGENGTASFGGSAETGIEAGLYFVQPIASTKIYQTMLISSTPTIEVDQTTGGITVKYAKTHILNLKSTSAAIKKLVSTSTATATTDAETVAQLVGFTYTDSITRARAADGASTVEKGDDHLAYATYQIAIDVPKYQAELHPTLKVEDTIPAGLTMEGDPVVIADNTTILSENSAYAKTIANQNLTIDFTNYYTSANLKNYNKIYIYYKVKVNNTTGVGTYTNNAKLTYSKYPYVNDTSVMTTESSTSNLSVYGLEIDKVNQEKVPLNGAIFQLYRVAETGETGNATITIDGKSISVVDLGTIEQTAADIQKLAGSSYYDGLVAGQTYYIQETQAPTGYNLDTTYYKIEVPSDNLNNYFETDFYHTTSVTNNAQTLNLPQTGATGMVIFTIVGVSVMGAAAAILIAVLVVRKKRS